MCHYSGVHSICMCVCICLFTVWVYTYTLWLSCHKYSFSLLICFLALLICLTLMWAVLRNCAHLKLTHIFRNAVIYPSHFCDFLVLYDHPVLTGQISYISCVDAVALTSDFITIDRFQWGHLRNWAHFDTSAHPASPWMRVSAKCLKCQWHCLEY